MLNTQFVFSPTFNRKLQVVSMDLTNLSTHNGAMLLALNGTRALSLIFWCRASSLPLATTIINFFLQDVLICSVRCLSQSLSPSSSSGICIKFVCICLLLFACSLVLALLRLCFSFLCFLRGHHLCSTNDLV